MASDESMKSNEPVECRLMDSRVRRHAFEFDHETILHVVGATSVALTSRRTSTSNGRVICKAVYGGVYSSVEDIASLPCRRNVYTRLPEIPVWILIIFRDARNSHPFFLPHPHPPPPPRRRISSFRRRRSLSSTWSAKDKTRRSEEFMITIVETKVEVKRHTYESSIRFRAKFRFILERWEIFHILCFKCFQKLGKVSFIKKVESAWVHPPFNHRLKEWKFFKKILSLR